MTPADMTIEEYEALTPHARVTVGDKEIIYATPNAVALWRARTLFEKEPATTGWIAEFTDADVLLDVGANVGTYSVLAAAGYGARVFAFEPESQNFALLCLNVALNRLGDKVTAWPAAISDEAGFATLYMSEFKAGSSCHAFGEALDFNLQPFRTPITQGAVAATVDGLVADGVIEVPTRIKIDVDGMEHKVITGAAKTLADKRVDSLVVELNPALAEHRGVIERLAELGFAYDPAQAAASARKEGDFEGIGEYVFRR